jgi:hypothetical protein
MVKLARGIPIPAANAITREADCWFFRRLCDASRDGAITIVTSMLSIAECVHVDEEPLPSQETRNLIIEFLSSGSVVDLVEPDLFVMERARDLRWLNDVRLGGADSIHVATALLDGCSEFLTLEKKIEKSKVVLSIPKLQSMGLSVLRPSQTGCLPNEYRSDDLFKDDPEAAG